MKKITKKVMLLAFGTLTTLTTFSQNSGTLQPFSQSFINLINETITGQTDTVPLAPITKVAPTTYVVSSNQKVNQSQNDFRTTCLNGTISTVWQQNYNASNKKAFTTATTTDGLGNIYVVGSTYMNTANGQDLTVIKYNNTGVQQWVKHYNGNGSSYDIASDVVVDNQGNVFVTGSSFGGFLAQMDYVTIKFNSSGTQLWASRYNFANGLDIPVGIGLDQSGNPFVTGSSASMMSNANMDFATVKYNKNNGNQITAQRQVNAGTAKDQVIAKTTDANGNIYVTGSTSSNGTDFDIQIIKYDNAMNVLWVQTFDGYGKSDQGNDIALDANGNIYVTGYVTNQAFNKQMILLSLNNNGVINWKSYKQPKTSQDAEGIKLQVKSPTEIFVGGNYNNGLNQDIFFYRFNNQAQSTLYKDYNDSGNQDNALLDMIVDGSKIVISAQTKNGTLNQNVSLLYTYKDFVSTPNVSNLAVGKIIDNQVIIKFHKKALKAQAINDRKLQYGTLGEFVADSTISKIASLLGMKEEAKSLEIRKIHLGMNEADSLTFARTGEVIKVPDVYCSLLLYLPSTINTNQAADNIKSIFPDVIYAHCNNIYEPFWTPNDPNYQVNQSSLHPTIQYPYAHVHVENAWNYNKGKFNVNVGVIDQGMFAQETEWAGRVTNGYDFFGNQPMDPFFNTDGSHGMAVASILGGNSNNGIGVAGVAGGDVANGFTGCELTDMRVFGTNGIATSADIKFAFMQGALAKNTFTPTMGGAVGYGLNVANNSYGNHGPNYSYDYSMIEGMRFLNKAGVAFVSARGNFGNNNINDTINPPNGPAAPAVLRPHTNMLVGATGNDGNRAVATVSNGVGYTSPKGYNIDFMAPGSRNNVYAAVFNGSAPPQFVVNPNPVSFLTYTTFGGTSASAPHVSGAAALMMSHRNQITPSWDNLVHEDCEAILKRTAIDLNQNTYFLGSGANLAYQQNFGVDDATGYGKINTELAVEAVSSPKYNIRHIDPTHNCTGFTTNTVLVASNVLRRWDFSAFIGAGDYVMDVYRIDYIYSYNYSTETYLGAWGLYKNSVGAHPTTNTNSVISVFDDDYSQVLTANTTLGYVSTYQYHFKNASNTTFFVFPNANLIPAFTLYTQTTPTGLKDNEPIVKFYNVYPNPTTGNLTVSFASPKSNKATIYVTDITGKQVYLNNNLTINEGSNSYQINIQNLVTGVYFINLAIDGNRTMVKKIIKD